MTKFYKNCRYLATTEPLSHTATARSRSFFTVSGKKVRLRLHNTGGLQNHFLFTLHHFDYTLSVHASSFWLHTFCSCVIILITHFLSLPHHFTKVKFISFTLQYTILIINNHVLSTPHNLDYIKIIFRSCLLFIPVKASFFTKLFFYCLLLWREKCFFWLLRL